MSVASGGSGNSALIFVVILLLIVLMRLRRIIYGTRVSLARTLIYSIFYVGFSALVLLGSVFLPIPVEYFAIYPILFVATFFAAFEVARRRVVFWKATDGSIYSKGGIPIYLFYIAGLIARIAIGYIYIGPNFFFSMPVGTSVSLSDTAITATTVTDLLLVAGSGLLFGRNMRILRKYLAIRSGKEIVDTPREEGESSPSVPT